MTRRQAEEVLLKRVMQAMGEAKACSEENIYQTSDQLWAAARKAVRDAFREAWV